MCSHLRFDCPKCLERRINLLCTFFVVADLAAASFIVVAGVVVGSIVFGQQFRKGF